MSKMSVTENEMAEALKDRIQEALRQGRGWELDLADLRPIIHEHMDRLINTPETRAFMEAVPLEAVHQVDRWGVAHDAGKDPMDFFWLIGWLAGKATQAAQRGDTEKAKHHTISTSAVLLNWHRRLSGKEESFQPGHAETIDLVEYQS